MPKTGDVVLRRIFFSFHSNRAGYTSSMLPHIGAVKCATGHSSNLLYFFLLLVVLLFTSVRQSTIAKSVCMFWIFYRMPQSSCGPSIQCMSLHINCVHRAKGVLEVNMLHIAWHGGRLAQTSYINLLCTFIYTYNMNIIFRFSDEGIYNEHQPNVVTILRPTTNEHSSLNSLVTLFILWGHFWNVTATKLLLCGYVRNIDGATGDVRWLKEQQGREWPLTKWNTNFLQLICLI